MISIIMPVFNEEKHLRECLDSILAQTMSHWELIAVDDFSSDSSKSILKEYSSIDPRISFYTNNKKGIVPALNLAYKNARYQAITRMDADDIMPPRKLEILYNQLLTQPNACITGKVKYFSENKLQQGFKKYATWLNDLIDQNNHYQKIYQECVVPSPCWAMNKTTIEKIGGITNDVYPEDYDLIFRLYEHKISIKGVDEVLHLWRDHEERASRNDKNYQDQGFYPLKMKYFLQIDRKTSKELILWGCGTAGKNVAKQLLQNKEPFIWTCQNENKIGKEIYGITLQPFSNVITKRNTQILIAIKQREFKMNQKDTFTSFEKNKCELYFFH